MQFLAGDLAACFGTDRTSRCVQLVTASAFAPSGLRFPPSHIAILSEVEDRMLWVEATTLVSRPCLIRGQVVRGTQAHLPEDRLEDYQHSGGRVEIYRLTHFNRLSPDERELLGHLLIEDFVKPGLSYDFAGAFVSGTRLLRSLARWTAADLNSLFCSELVAAILMRLNRMNHENPVRFHPGRVLRTLVRTGKYFHFATAVGTKSRPSLGVGRD